MQQNTEMVPYHKSRGKNLNVSLGLDWCDHPFHCGQTQDDTVMVLPTLWLCLPSCEKQHTLLRSWEMKWLSGMSFSLYHTCTHRASSTCALTCCSEQAAASDVNPVLTKKKKYIPGQASVILLLLLSLLGYKEALHPLLKQNSTTSLRPLCSRFHCWPRSCLFCPALFIPLASSQGQGIKTHLLTLLWCCPYSYSEGGPRMHISFICPIPPCMCLTFLWHPSAFGKGMICESNISMDNK